MSDLKSSPSTADTVDAVCSSLSGDMAHDILRLFSVLAKSHFKENRAAVEDAIEKSRTAISIAEGFGGQEPLLSRAYSLLRGAIGGALYALRLDIPDNMARKVAETPSVPPAVIALRDLSIAAFGRSGADTASVLEKKEWTLERRVAELGASSAARVGDALTMADSRMPGVNRPGVAAFRSLDYVPFIGHSSAAERLKKSLDFAFRSRLVSPLASLLEETARMLGEEDIENGPSKHLKELMALATDTNGVNFAEFVEALKPFADQGPREKSGHSPGSARVLDMNTGPIGKTADEKKSAASSAVKPDKPVANQFVMYLVHSVLKAAVREYHLKHGEVCTGTESLKLSALVDAAGSARFALTVYTKKSRDCFMTTLKDAALLVDGESQRVTFTQEVRDEAVRVIRNCVDELSKCAVYSVDESQESLNGIQEVIKRSYGKFVRPRVAVPPAAAAPAPAEFADAKSSANAGLGGSLHRAVGAVMAAPSPAAMTSSKAWTEDSWTQVTRGKSGGTRDIRDVVWPLKGAAMPSVESPWTKVTRGKPGVARDIREAAGIRDRGSDPFSWKSARSNLKESVGALERGIEDHNRAVNQKAVQAPSKSTARVFAFKDSGVEVIYPSYFTGKTGSAEVIFVSDISDQSRQLLKNIRGWCVNGVARSDLTSDSRYYWQNRVLPLFDSRLVPLAGRFLLGANAAEKAEILQKVSMRAQISVRSMWSLFRNKGTSVLGYSRRYWESERVWSLCKWIAAVCHQLEPAGFRPPGTDRSQGFPPEIVYHPLRVFEFARTPGADGKPRHGNSWFRPPVFKKEKSGSISNSGGGKRPSTLEDRLCNAWRKKIANVLFHLRTLLTWFTVLSPFISKERLKGTRFEVLSALLVFYNPESQLHLNAPESQARCVSWIGIKTPEDVKVEVLESRKGREQSADLSRLQAVVATRNRIADMLVCYWRLDKQAKTGLSAKQIEMIESRLMQPWVRRFWLALVRYYGKSREQTIPGAKEIFCLPRYIQVSSSGEPLIHSDPDLAFLKSQERSLFGVVASAQHILSSSVAQLSLFYLTMRQIDVLRHRAVLNDVIRGWLSDQSIGSAWEGLSKVDKSLKEDAAFVASVVISLYGMCEDMEANSWSDLSVVKTAIRAHIFHRSELSVTSLSIISKSQKNRLLNLMEKVLTFVYGESGVSKEAVLHCLSMFALFLSNYTPSRSEVASVEGYEMLRVSSLKDYVQESGPVKERELYPIAAPTSLEARSYRLKKKGADADKALILLHRNLWEGDFRGCYNWLLEHLDSNVPESSRQKLEYLFYVACGQHHSIVRLNGVDLIKQNGIAYASSTGAYLDSRIQEMAMGMSPKTSVLSSDSKPLTEKFHS